MRRRKLKEVDMRAIDLLLDHANTETGVTRVTESVPPKNIKAAKKLLSLIGQMKAEEPPHDLLARTLARCGERPSTATVSGLNINPGARPA